MNSTTRILALVVCLLAITVHSQAADKPNVLFIAVDDLLGQFAAGWKGSLPKADGTKLH